MMLVRALNVERPGGVGHGRNRGDAGFAAVDAG